MLLRVGQNQYGFPDARLLPAYHIAAGLIGQPGDTMGRTKPGSLIEHTFMLDYEGRIAHSPGPGDVFRADRLQTVLVPGSLIRVISPSHSLQETQRRFARAQQIMGVPWWNMTCSQATDFIVGSWNLYRM